MSILFFPSLFKLFLQRPIENLQQQILVSKMYGLSKPKIIFEVINQVYNFAVQIISVETERHKRQNNLLGFDDMITKLHQAVVVDAPLVQAPNQGRPRQEHLTPKYSCWVDANCSNRKKCATQQKPRNVSKSPPHKK